MALGCLGEEGNVKSDPNASDWSAAYLARAAEIGLTDDLTGKAGELLRCGDFAVLADRIAEALADRAAETAETTATGASDTTDTTTPG